MTNMNNMQSMYRVPVYPLRVDREGVHILYVFTSKCGVCTKM